MKKLVILTAALAAAANALAASQSFNFKDPKGVNNVVFKTDAPLEAINGSASGVSGTVSFDPANPGATTGRIVVDAKTMTVPNKMMNEHMLGDQWLNANKHTEISFEVKKLANVKTTGDTTTANATGTFSLKGVTKEITVPVKLTYLKDKLGARMPNMKGDLLVVRSNFQVKRSDYDINPKAPADKVADEIDISLSLAGFSLAN